MLYPVHSKGLPGLAWADLSAFESSLLYQFARHTYPKRRETHDGPESNGWETGCDMLRTCCILGRIIKTEISLLKLGAVKLTRSKRHTMIKVWSSWNMNAGARLGSSLGRGIVPVFIWSSLRLLFRLSFLAVFICVPTSDIADWPPPCSCSSCDSTWSAERENCCWQCSTASAMMMSMQGGLSRATKASQTWWVQDKLWDRQVRKSVAFGFYYY